jgi:hypothetical protein
MDTKDDLHAFVVVAFLQTAWAYFNNNVHIRLRLPWHASSVGKEYR